MKKIDVEKLTKLLQQQCPQIRLAFLHGSAKDGILKNTGDIDIAVLIDGKAGLELYEKIYDIVESVVGKADCDVGILNNAEPVFRFEALKGKLMFFRDQEEYLHFFSLTCREYESQMADYQRQKRYRLMKA
ncbi:MAG: nucleotidyltransferase domain-containing protein [Planctomycetota bacterium]|jgi:predicted nucleotidyltransferase